MVRTTTIPLLAYISVYLLTQLFLRNTSHGLTDIFLIYCYVRAKEQGYVVRMVELPRIGPLYNKRELLLGAKKGTEVATRLSSCLDIISSTPV